MNPRTYNQEEGVMPEDKAPEGGRKPFAAFIQEQRKGLLHGELSDSLAELLLAVSELRKPARSRRSR